MAVPQRLKRLIFDRTLRFRVVLGIVLAGALFLAVAPWLEAPWRQGSELSGRATVVDGDSLRIGRDRLRLEGIDAPELAQNCRRRARSWACGREAKAHLARMIGGREINCNISKKDQYGRLLGRCRIGKTDINQAMVVDGMAVAFGRSYRREENQARVGRRGLWAGEFVRPQIWRRDNPRE